MTSIWHTTLLMRCWVSFLSELVSLIAFDWISQSAGWKCWAGDWTGVAALIRGHDRFSMAGHALCSSKTRGTICVELLGAVQRTTACTHLCKTPRLLQVSDAMHQNHNSAIKIYLGWEGDLIWKSYQFLFIAILQLAHSFIIFFSQLSEHMYLHG